MKRLFSLIVWCILIIQVQAQTYIPSPLNIHAREIFSNDRFGLFIHWGIFSVPGAGEWVMNEKGISVKNYKRLVDFFNPIDFDAAQWVTMAKNAGMKYITLITRHHDGFSMWDTKFTDYNIMHTLYKKDVVKQMADECHKQGIQLFLYYSLLDWSRDDYPHSTGRTGQKSGRKGKEDYSSYLQFMKNQLTELLTNYGKIDGVWFDGHWDQTLPEDAKDRTSRVDWHYEEIYQLIHKLQPGCLIGNNHHLTPFIGEDFQMFERDLPGENNSGLSFQKPSQQLPLETCETMNNSWGFNITDTSYKSSKKLIHYLVNAAGRNANFLLNIGPMPNGKIQQEFIDTLKEIGNWLQVYGETIYGTKGNIITPQKWGVITAKNKRFFVHILNTDSINAALLIPHLHEKIIKSFVLGKENKINFRQAEEGIYLDIKGIQNDKTDNIIELDIK